MSHECPNCGDLKGNGKCQTCGWDPWDDDSGGFAFDGGTVVAGPGEDLVLPDTIGGHLEAALELAEEPEARYHIRSALQHLALREGRVGWRGTYGPENGGVVD